jgi:autotransporter-associated beta strand protein
VTIGGATNHLNVNLGGVTRTMSVAASRTLTLNDVVSNGDIIKTGTGTLRLNGLNTVGDVAVNDGMLFTENSGTFGNLSIASGKTFQFGAQDAAYTININGLSGAGTFTTANSGGYQRNLTLGNNDATADFSGVITQASNRALVLKKLGTATQTLSGATANTQAGGTGVGFDTYIQAGTMILNKTAAIALPGDVFINGGTLQLSGSGDNQIADTAAVTWSSGAFDLNGRSETIGALTVSVLSASANQINIAAGKTFTAAGNANIFNSAATTPGTSVTFNSAGSVPTSTFAVTGASSFIFGQDSTTSSTTRTNSLDMRNLGVFNAGTSGTALTNCVIGNYVQATGGNYNNGGIITAYLAPSSTIYATSFGVGKKVTGQPGQFNTAMYLGSGTTAIHATTITVGEVGAISTGSTLKWDAGVTGGVLTLNGTGTTSAVTNMSVGYKSDTASASAGGRLGTVDLSNGTVTGNITNLYIGYKPGTDSGNNNPVTTGVFNIGAGAAGASSNLTIGNLTLAHSGQAVTNRNNPVNGTFQMDGGTVAVTGNIVLTNENAYDQRTGTLTINGGAMTVGGNITSGITRATSTLTLSGGTLDMTSGDIGTATNPISAFNFYSGTLSNAGSIHAGSATVRTVTADNETITLTSPETFSVSGAGGFTLGADTGANSTHKLTLAGTGSFAVRNATANVVIGVAQANQAWNNTATLDLSGLSGVVLGDSTTAINELRVGFGQTTSGSLLLSNTANTINANVVSVGHSNGSNNSGAPSITLGTGINTVAADTINLGVSKGNGTLKFASQTSGSPGTVTITDQAGTGGATIIIGSNNGTATGAGAAGLLDLRGHTATVTAGTVTLGYSNNAPGTGTPGTPTGTLSFDAGTFTATTLNMASLAATSNIGNVTGTLNIGGGAFTVGTLGVANKSAAGTGTATGNINVSGGSLTVNTAFSLATQATAGASAGTLTITGGAVTSNADILDGGGASSTSKITLNGGTLDLTGHAIGNATNNINTLEFQSGTLQNVAAINGTGGLTKTGAGVLTLNANNYAGPSTINGGTVMIDGADDLGDSSATNSIFLNTGTLRSTSGTYSLGTSRAISLTNTNTITNDSGVLTVDGIISGEGGLLNIGSSTVGANVTLSGDNLFTGNVSLPASNEQPRAVLTLTHSGALGIGPKTVTCVGGTTNQGGEIHLQNNITLAADISFTTSGFAIYNDSGDNTINGNFSLFSGNGDTILTSASGSLTVNGDLIATATGRNLKLRGDGTGAISGIISNGSTVALKVFKDVGTGTWTLSGPNTYTGATIVSAGTLALGTTGSITDSTGITLGAGATLDTVAKATFAMTATQPVAFGINAAGAGSSGRIVADGLDISAAVVTFNVTGILDDPAYVLATYSSGGLTGTQFNSVTPPAGYMIDYAHNGGTQIALVQSAASGFASWITGTFPGGSVPGGQQGANDDPDNDGLENLLEFVLDGDPTRSDSAILPELDASGSNFIFSFTRREESANDTTQVFQYGSDLTGWTDVNITAPTAAEVTLGTPVGDLQSVTVTIPKGSNTSLFGRLKVTQP